MTTYGAKWAKHRFYRQDPLPCIEPALLNSLDIGRYVEKGCLLDKERFDPELLKPASYEIRLLGKLYWWEEEEGRLEKRCRLIVEGDCVKLGRNSISYLWIEERLRLPEYIAARFNLRISDVHKGLLLGTGPLIDPGFGGQILIPLHNLTDNNYFLRGGEGIIWVEFTKVSQNCFWLGENEEADRPKGLVKFPSDKVTDDPDDYLNKAGAARGVQSAYKGALVSTRRAAGAAKSAAEAAKTRAERIQRFITGIGIGGLIAVIVGVAGLWFSALDISGQVADRVHGQGERIGALEGKLEDLKARLNGVVVAPAVESGTPGEETESDGDQPADDYDEETQ